MPKKITQKEYIDRCRSIHGEKYKYPDSYKGMKNLHKIICSKHGGFLQTLISHIYSKCGCPKCGIEKNNKDREQRLKENRKPIYIDDYALFPLNKGKFTKVDLEDVEFISQWKWCCDTNGYAVRIARVRGGSKTIRMHRKIMNPLDHQVIDHINHDILDNRKKNLRICSQSENSANQRIKSNNSSGYKGVCLIKNGRYRSRVMKDGKQVHLGYYSTAKEAGKAYNKKAKELFGEFAKLNKI